MVKSTPLTTYRQKWSTPRYRRWKMGRSKRWRHVHNWYMAGRAATKGWAPLHGRRVAQVRCGCFFREESLKRYIAERLQAGGEPADIKCPGVMPGTALFPAQKCPQNLAPHRLLLP